ncbi:cupin domain-containing protein [Gordonia jinhuaensis]|uniref:Cupin n=1 Tax=Gordonia jinhuaensis TaxID=1517702 RepID=A0A916SZB4_9ACTN|nr:cupin domain-containing protein [Gordonia jinhuaensis]GGB23252.1 cupin [Gordonia jinhuaensis]
MTDDLDGENRPASDDERTARLPDWAHGLDLRPHPEGGWFRQTWVSDVTVPTSILPDGYEAPRASATAILFLLLPDEQSAWHRVRGAEIWLYHRGAPVELSIGGGAAAPGRAHTVRLGPDLAAGDRPQFVIAPGEWQRARPAGDEASLVTCVVSPGFDFADFVLA